MQRFLAVIFSVFLISACTIPETKIYSIYMTTPPLPPFSNGEIRMGVNEIDSTAEKSLIVMIDAPRYLSQAYIAYRNSPYQLEISRYSKWESPPNNMVREAFKTRIFSTGDFKEVRSSNIVPNGFYSLAINLKKFERYDEGNDSFGDLFFDVQLSSPDGKELYHQTISKHVKLDDETFLSLAKGLSAALSESIEEVSESITGRFKK